MALSANTQREKQTVRPTEVLVVPVNAGSHIYAGGIVMREAATSVFVPGADTSGCVFAGIALEELNNTGADGTVDGLVAARAIRVERGGVYEFAVTGTTPKPFGTAYVSDDNTVTADVGNGVKCGIFLRKGPAGDTWLVDTSYAHAADPLGDPEAFVADASVAHALNATFSDTEVETALNALGTKINSILDVLIAKGLMASS